MELRSGWDIHKTEVRPQKDKKILYTHSRMQARRQMWGSTWLCCKLATVSSHTCSLYSSLTRCAAAPDLWDGSQRLKVSRAKGYPKQADVLRAMAQTTHYRLSGSQPRQMPNSANTQQKPGPKHLDLISLARLNTMYPACNPSHHSIMTKSNAEKMSPDS